MKKKEITRKGFCWMILYYFKEGVPQKECLVPLCETLSNEALSEKTVYNSFAEFRRSGASVSI